MPHTPHGAAIMITAAQIRGATVGIAAIMVAVGVGGLITSLIADKPSPALRMAYTASLSGLVFLGLAVIAFAALRGQAAVIRHQAGIERAAVDHFKALEDHQEERAAKITKMIDDGLQERLDQIESLVLKVHQTTERQTAVLSEVVIELGKHRDELSQRRSQRGG